MFETMHGDEILKLIVCMSSLLSSTVIVTNVFLKKFGFNKEDRCSIATERHGIKRQPTLNNTISEQVFNICCLLEHLCIHSTNQTGLNEVQQLLPVG